MGRLIRQSARRRCAVIPHSDSTVKAPSCTPPAHPVPVDAAPRRSYLTTSPSLPLTIEQTSYSQRLPPTRRRTVPVLSCGPTTSARATTTTASAGEATCLDSPRPNDTTRKTTVEHNRSVRQHRRWRPRCPSATPSSSPGGGAA